MPIPKACDMYDVILDCLIDEQKHTGQEIRDAVCQHFHISQKEREELIPSGGETVLNNRVRWAWIHLKKAGLLESQDKGIYQLTKRGKKVLKERPAIIDNQYLSTFPEFYAFTHSRNNRTNKLEVVDETELNASPQDMIDKAFTQMNIVLSDDLLSEILKQTPAFFEWLVIKLLEKMGYGGSLENAGKITGKVNDEGIDGIIREDKLGFDTIYIQAKKWERNKAVGRPEIQKFVGALVGQGATKGLFITTATFTKEAKAYAKKQHTTKIVLVDGNLLTKLMIEHNLGVSTETCYEIKRIDSDFFRESID